MTTPIERFAEDFGITLSQAKRLRTLVNKAARAQEFDEEEADRRCSQVDNYSRRLGLGTDWRPGIYPRFTKGELSRNFPD